ncbi:hypothetical protein BU24DRAFT_417787 [Aaosphaeria arxii CBS 175.79]|uniref:Altered inheritance of mitochondria protein 11 n=1 Tax=Aaosphaeria arxii CBS 175.79 TaxID=1450172 RepID=A0A6A5YAS6_9PLEO|nr:uncharacterized protein BU24DRAFT_417787 [Aaosphaeria arxii CBS 175.79]KAF2022127.1 hypothetical protein BU24DRAFT_417787 [Aaosphaeria arxii CBS 175.79]
MSTPPSDPAKPSPAAKPKIAYETTPITSTRSLKQLSIFFFGAACLVASTAITRRAVHRRQLRKLPKFYEPNTNPHEHFSPASDALQALNLATMNCVSFGIMSAGGALWAFDLSGLKEMRAALRGRLGYEQIFRSEEDNPAAAGVSAEEMEAWRKAEGDGKHRFGSDSLRRD